MDVREKQLSEKRLIDANALMYVISRHDYLLATKQGSIDYGMFTLGIQQAVDEQPTIDAVPVVRCKDCEHFKIDEDNVYYCRRDKIGSGIFMQKSDFCSYGKRKEGADNG